MPPCVICIWTWNIWFEICIKLNMNVRIGVTFHVFTYLCNLSYFVWNLFLCIQLMSHLWFKWYHDATQVLSHYLHQWQLRFLCIRVSLDLKELKYCIVSDIPCEIIAPLRILSLQMNWIFWHLHSTKHHCAAWCNFPCAPIDCLVNMSVCQFRRRMFSRYFNSLW